jgi:hypothetical protein
MRLVMHSNLLSFLSLANTKQTLSAWFHKPHRTMGFNHWDAIIDRTLAQPIPVFLSFFNKAASESNSSDDLLSRLAVVYILLHKQTNNPLEHEFLVIETKDTKDGTMRTFILERMVVGQATAPAPQRPMVTKKDSGYQVLENVQQGIANYIRSPSPSRPITPLSAMEEGLASTSTSTLSPPLLSPHRQLSKGDTLSLFAAKTSQSVKHSLKGDNKAIAYDRILGESYLLQTRYGCGRNALQIKPNDLKLFELIVIASAVHDFAPEYTMLERNCFWFCNMVVDVLMEVVNVDEIGTIARDESESDNQQYVKMDDIRGRWNGWKVTQTDPAEVSMIVKNFRKLHTEELTEVNLFFF